MQHLQLLLAKLVLSVYHFWVSEELLLFESISHSPLRILSKGGQQSFIWWAINRI